MEAILAPQELEDGGQPTVDEHMEINLGSDELVVDATAELEALSLMGGSSGYNQIKMT
jgi:hypothetical protein